MKTRKTKDKTMSKIIWITLFFAVSVTYAQMGVGTNNPHNSAALEISSTSKGFLPPRLTEDQIIAISNPAEGLMVYCTDCTIKGIYIFNGDIYTNTAETSAIYNFITGAAGAKWMDRNLGASRVATASSDHLAYGSLFQWGRLADGHEVINWTSSSTTDGTELSRVTNVTSSTDVPGHGDFITNTNAPLNWRVPENDLLWQGTNGVNNPCPNGSRVPTESEFQTEVNAWASSNLSGAYNNPLKLTASAFRNSDGSVLIIGLRGYYWTSTYTNSGINTGAKAFVFADGGLIVENLTRVYGYSVRCIKD